MFHCSPGIFSSLRRRVRSSKKTVGCPELTNPCMFILSFFEIGGVLSTLKELDLPEIKIFLRRGFRKACLISAPKMRLWVLLEYFWCSMFLPVLKQVLDKSGKTLRACSYLPPLYYLRRRYPVFTAVWWGTNRCFPSRKEWAGSMKWVQNLYYLVRLSMYTVVWKTTAFELSPRRRATSSRIILKAACFLLHMLQYHK